MAVMTYHGALLKKGNYYPSQNADLSFVFQFQTF